MLQFVRRAIPTMAMLGAMAGAVNAQNAHPSGLDAAMARAERTFTRPSNHDVADAVAYRAEVRGQGFAAEFSAQGALNISAGADRIGVRATAFGHGATRGQLELAKAETGTDLDKWPTLTFARNQLTEWYVNGQTGLHHWMRVASRPGTGNGNLWVRLGVTGDVRSKSLTDGAIEIRSRHHVMSYGGLRAWDANGRDLPARFDLRDQDVSVTVDDRDAAYPVTIDPIWTQQQAFASPADTTGDNFGYSVSVLGNTAIVSSVGHFASDSGGAAFVFTRPSGSTSSGAWSLEATLLPNDGGPNYFFGASVSLAATSTGITALVGSPLADSDRGAAYVFTRTGGVWTQAAKLVANDRAPGRLFGERVALSGNTAMIADGDLDSSPPVPGAVYMFTGAGASWPTQQKLTTSSPTGIWFGLLVAVNGDLAAIGAPSDSQNNGVVDVYARSQGVWNLQQTIVSPHPNAQESFGQSVAITDDNLLVGAIGATDQAFVATGAAYVYVHANGSWTLQQELIPPSGPADIVFYGWSVSLYGDLAAIGALSDPVPNDFGNVFVYVRNNGTWKPQQTLAASDAHADGGFGYQVSINGDTILVGSEGSEPFGAYIFTTPASVQLSFGPALPGGSVFLGTLVFSEPAPVGGTTVGLRSDSEAVSVPTSVAVPEGATSVEFACLTAPVASDVSATVTATCKGYASSSASLKVLAPQLKGIRFRDTEVNLGGTTTLTATLTGAASSGGVVLQLRQNVKGALAFPSTITVPEGQSASTCVVTGLGPLTSDVIDTVTGNTATSSARINGSLIVTDRLDLASLTLASPAIGVGQSTIATVTLAGPAGPKGQLVNLKSSDPSVRVASSVTVPAGATSLGTSVSSTGVAGPDSVTIKASVGATIKSTTLRLLPNGVKSVSLSKVDCSELGTSVLTVTLLYPQPKSLGTLTITVTSSMQGIVNSFTVTVKPGASTGSATIVPTFNALSATRNVHLTANYGSASYSAMLAVHSEIVSLTLSDETLVGGASAKGTITQFESLPGNPKPTVTTSTNSKYADSIFDRWGNLFTGDLIVTTTDPPKPTTAIATIQLLGYTRTVKLMIKPQ